MPVDLPGADCYVRMSSRDATLAVKTDNVMNWIHLATGLGVFVGLLLVYIELQQAKQLTAADLISQGFSEGLSTQRAVMGENFADIYAKVCLRPDELTEGEVVALDYYFQSQLVGLYRLEYLKDIGGLGQAPVEVLVENLRPILATRLGRRWMQQREIPSSWEGVLENWEPADCTDYYRELGSTSFAEEIHR